MSDPVLFGWFDDSDQTTPSHDPPHDAPCIICGRAIVPDDVRTHSLMYVEGYGRRGYFYRTHRTCADVHGAPDGVILDMIASSGE